MMWMDEWFYFGWLMPLAPSLSSEVYSILSSQIRHFSFPLGSSTKATKLTVFGVYKVIPFFN